MSLNMFVFDNQTHITIKSMGRSFQQKGRKKWCIRVKRKKKKKGNNNVLTHIESIKFFKKNLGCSCKLLRYVSSFFKRILLHGVLFHPNY